MRREKSGPRRTLMVSVRPADLQPGDVVEYNGARCEVVGGPFLGQSGASAFDSVRLFWRARLRLVDDVDWTVNYGTWPVGCSVAVIRCTRRSIDSAIGECSSSARARTRR
jgi:hypothetical protein